MGKINNFYKFKFLFCFVLLYVSSLFSLCTVYFTPRDDIKAHLLELIKSERKSIDAAMYMLTDKTVAQAIVDAYVRGVKVNLVLDQISMSERFGKGLFLQKNGISVFPFYTSSSSNFFMPIMHHKFFIFGMNDLYKRSLLWTGSFNCSIAASTLHDENVIVTDDQAVIEEYRQCFKQLVKKLS